jgi:hypothetical protein
LNHHLTMSRATCSASEVLFRTSNRGKLSVAHSAVTLRLCAERNRQALSMHCGETRWDREFHERRNYLTGWRWNRKPGASFGDKEVLIYNAPMPRQHEPGVIVVMEDTLGGTKKRKRVDDRTFAMDPMILADVLGGTDDENEPFPDESGESQGLATVRSISEWVPYEKVRIRDGALGHEPDPLSENKGNRGGYTPISIAEIGRRQQLE